MKMETFLTWGAAGLLVLAGWIIQTGGETGGAGGANTDRRLTGARRLSATAGQERLLGRVEEQEMTVVAPIFAEEPRHFDQWGIPGVPSRVKEVRVPAKVSLISSQLKVTSSNPEPIGELSLITDGDKRFDDGFYVDLLPGSQWIQLDLGASREIWLIWTWMFFKHPVIYRDVIIQISDDPEFKVSRTVYNNDRTNRCGHGAGTEEPYVDTNNGHPVSVNGIQGRYVRLYSNGRNIDDTNQWTEVEIYGR